MLNRRAQLRRDLRNLRMNEDSKIFMTSKQDFLS